MGKIKAWLWKTFLRIGHDLTWKVEGWFQDQEIKLRRIEGEHEGSDAEYRQNGDHQWNQFPCMGRAIREGNQICGIGESLGGRESAGPDRSNPRVERKTQRLRSGAGARANHVGPDAVPGSPARRKRTRSRVSAAEFDRRTVANRSAFAGMVLNHGQVAG